MSKLYVIQWKSKTSGRAGRGSKLFELHEAQQLVEELNLEYPDIQHEVVEAASAEGAPHQPEHQSGAEPSSEQSSVPSSV